MRFKIGNTYFEEDSGKESQERSFSKSTMKIKLGNGKSYQLSKDSINIIDDNLSLNIGEDIDSVFNQEMSKLQKELRDFLGTEDEKKEKVVPEEPKEYKPSEKKLSKAKLKEDFRKFKNIKFRLGEKYTIKHKQIRGRRKPEVYLLKQIVWCMDEYPICGLVVKQIEGHHMSRTYLSVHDCKNLHVKYEPGLHIMSMFLNWTLVKEKTNQ